MKIKTQHYDTISVIELQGDLTGEFTEMVQKAVFEATSKNSKGIVLDMSQTTFFDSEGLGMLLWLRDYCDQQKITLKLAALNDNCMSILQITRLENKFSHYDELVVAVKSFA